jgi:hypothetical protein
MRNFHKLALCSAVIWAVNAPTASAQDTTMPSWGGTELYACAMNEGKGPGDLMKVVKKWNAWSDKKDIAPYFAWVLNPIYAWDADFDTAAFWFGHSPSFTEMGEVAHAWLTEGGELRSEFNEVWTCNAHVEFASMIVHGGGGEVSSGYASFSDCSFREGMRFTDLMEATAKYNAYLDANEVEGVTVYHLPGHGNPQDKTYDMKISEWVSDMKVYGANAEKYVNGDGWKAYRETVGSVVSCDSPRMYSATLVRGGN